MELIITIVTGCLSLVGIILSNILSNKSIEHKLELNQAVTEVKIQQLTDEVQKHNNFATRLPVLEERINEIERRLNKNV